MLQGEDLNVTEKKPYYTRLFWAKAQPYRQQGPERIHLLEHHRPVGFPPAGAG